MRVFESSDDQEPVMWLRGYPLYAAHFVVLVFVVSMLVTTLFMFAGRDAILGWLTFSSVHALSGQVWRIFTYGLVNQPSLFFAIDMVMIVWFGREVERAFGRRKFLIFYGGLYLLPPLLFTVLGPWLPTQLQGVTGAFALFVAFATLYPNVPLLFSILAKWAAMILVGLYTLIHLSRRDIVGLLALWSTVGFAFAVVRHHQGLLSLPSFKLPKRRPKLRVLTNPGPTPQPSRSTVTRDSSMEEVDALLDKIAQSGIGSLTPAERAKLDAAQADLLRRKAGRR